MKSIQFSYLLIILNLFVYISTLVKDICSQKQEDQIQYTFFYTSYCSTHIYIYIYIKMRNSASPRYQQEQTPDSQSSSQQSQEEEYTKVKKKKNVAVVPRFIKNQIDEIDTEVIIVNISRTQYEVVEEVALEMGWQIQRSKKSQKWDIMWIDSHIEAHDLFKLNEHQKISHFPAIYVLTRKNFLGRSLMKMSRFFPEDYDFFPFTWAVPADYTELMRYDGNLSPPNGETQYYIYKPEAMAQGKGIKLYGNVQLLDGKKGIVQSYVNNPYLIEGLKFDLRIYVLIMGFDPLRIFIYDEGLGRFATEKYQKVGKKNMKDIHMHLTNYALNKNNKNFVFNTSEKSMDKGHKRSLSAIYKFLESKNIDVPAIKKKIDEMIIKTLIVGQPMIAHTYGLAQSDSQANDFCFQILGFDVMLTDQLKPIILEVNHTPSFKTDTPLDKHVKKNLIKDTLKLLNISVENKKEKIEQKKEFLEKRQQRKLQKISVEEKEAVKKIKNKEREQYQMNNLGNFRKIFPIAEETEKFQEMINYSKRIFNEQSGFKNKGVFMEKKSTQITRKQSFEKNTKNFTNVPVFKDFKKKLDLQEKSKSYSRTMANRSQTNKNTQIRNSSDRFPSIDYRKNQEKRRNFSGYISNSGKQSFSDHKQIPLQISSPPSGRKVIQAQKKTLQGLEQIQRKIFNRGSFIAPKVIQMEPLNDQSSPPQQRLILNNSNPSNFFSPTVIHKSSSKNKTIEQIVSESIFNKKSISPSPTKKSTFEYLIDNIQDVNLRSTNRNYQNFKLKLQKIASKEFQDK